MCFTSIILFDDPLTPTAPPRSHYGLVIRILIDRQAGWVILPDHPAGGFKESTMPTFSTSRP